MIRGILRATPNILEGIRGITDTNVIPLCEPHNPSTPS